MTSKGRGAMKFLDLPHKCVCLDHFNVKLLLWKYLWSKTCKQNVKTYINKGMLKQFAGSFGFESILLGHIYKVYNWIFPCFCFHYNNNSIIICCHYNLTTSTHFYRSHFTFILILLHILSINTIFKSYPTIQLP